MAGCPLAIWISVLNIRSMKSAQHHDKDDLAVATALSSPTDKPGLDHLTHRRTYDPSRAEAKASPSSCAFHHIKFQTDPLPPKDTA